MSDVVLANMPEYSFLAAVNMCLHMVKISVLIYWLIGDIPLLEAALSSLIGGLLGLDLFKLVVVDYVPG